MAPNILEKGKGIKKRNEGKKSSKAVGAVAGCRPTKTTTQLKRKR